MSIIEDFIKNIPPGQQASLLRVRDKELVLFRKKELDVA